MEYRIESAYCKYDNEICCMNLQEKVNEAIRMGFRPHGSVSVVYEENNHSYTAFQAMIKDD